MVWPLRIASIRPVWEPIHAIVAASPQQKSLADRLRAQERAAHAQLAIAPSSAQ